mmetsp:Transcript_145550/g.206134  ORF Transcript_145550/g.206134 Transcript_145550/m.206134 type:complete len:286 (+) Transcript_145550:678-1535(+)
MLVVFRLQCHNRNWSIRHVFQTHSHTANSWRLGRAFWIIQPPFRGIAESFAVVLQNLHVAIGIFPVVQLLDHLLRQVIAIAILDRGVGGLFRATLKSIDGDGVSMRRLVERGRIYLGIRPNFAVFIVGHRRLAATQRVLLLLLLLGLLPLVYLDLAPHPQAATVHAKCGEASILHLIHTLSIGVVHVNQRSVQLFVDPLGCNGLHLGHSQLKDALLLGISPFVHPHQSQRKRNQAQAGDNTPKCIAKPGEPRLVFNGDIGLLLCLLDETSGLWMQGHLSRPQVTF